MMDPLKRKPPHETIKQQVARQFIFMKEEMIVTKSNFEII